MAEVLLPERRILKGVGQQVVRFGEEWIVQTKGRWAGQPMHHEPWQKDWLDELFLVYDDGERVYKEAMLGIARKNGKSTISAEVALYLLLADREMGPEVYAAAASQDQARIVFKQAVEFIQSSPKLSDWLRPYRNVILCKANQGVFRVLSADAPLQYGLNPSGVVIDELWAHKNPELYYALTTGQGARLNPLVVIITTAGWDRESVCYTLYERGMKLMREGGIDAMRKAGYYFKWFEAPPTATVLDPTGWQAANPSSWITPRQLARDAERLPESVFRRLHLNQWTESEEAWIKPHKWDRLEGHPVINRDDPSWMAIDVGVRHDSAAILWGQWHDDKLHVGHLILDPEKEGERFGVADVRGFAAQKATGGVVGSVQEIAYDPWNFRESAEILSEGGLPMLEFPQNGARMGPASETLFELIEDGRLVHDGDRELRKHVLSAAAAPTDRGGWRISKRKSLERIDGCIALAMLADTAVTLRYTKPPPAGVVFY